MRCASPVRLVPSVTKISLHIRFSPRPGHSPLHRNLDVIFGILSLSLWFRPPPPLHSSASPLHPASWARGLERCRGAPRSHWSRGLSLSGASSAPRNVLQEEEYFLPDCCLRPLPSARPEVPPPTHTHTVCPHTTFKKHSRYLSYNKDYPVLCCLLFFFYNVFKLLNTIHKLYWYAHNRLNSTLPRLPRAHLYVLLACCT